MRQINVDCDLCGRTLALERAKEALIKLRTGEVPRHRAAS